MMRISSRYAYMYNPTINPNLITTKVFLDKNNLNFSVESKDDAESFAAALELLAKNLREYKSKLDII